ncbi:unnamed protein product [Strongylus vulgaris]|uniref:Uncharacterized protein n=1 Tax=Strongylus vulgaris TaxID=40348 RepID=A0A3P7JHA1_STRVU|nr:unnamed protein product [Strongylus vulgaris]VDM82413.1 unnamed protein product [Strongylus vulgaris]
MSSREEKTQEQEDLEASTVATKLNGLKAKIARKETIVAKEMQEKNVSKDVMVGSASVMRVCTSSFVSIRVKKFEPHIPLDFQS